MERFVDIRAFIVRCVLLTALWHLSSWTVSWEPNLSRRGVIEFQSDSNDRN